MPRGRRPGNSGTRQRILDAAADRFTATGYDAVSMRGIATDAGVDPALVRHFFGSKEGLFSEMVADQIRPDRVAAAARTVPTDRLGPYLVRYFLTLLGEVDAPRPMLGIMRSAVSNDHAAGLLRRVIAERVLAPIAASTVDRAELRASLCASQLVGMAVTRYAVRLPALVAASTEDVVAWLGPVLQRYLTGPPPADAHATTPPTNHPPNGHPATDG